MSIVKADEKDIAEIGKIVSREFAYKGLTAEKIAERMGKPYIAIFKKTLNGSFAGFVEIEINEHFGMINAVSVLEKYRKKGIGKELLNYAVEFLKEKGIPKAKLLVKQDNTEAKKLYASLGFEMTGIHSKKIDNCVAEVWKKKIFPQQENYLN